MTNEAHLEPLDSGLAPVTDGWFVVNARDAAWQVHPKFGARCTFELGRRVLGRRDDLEPAPFPQIGVNLDVFWPGQPSTPVPRGDGAGGLPRPGGRVRRDPRGPGAAAAGLGLRALPARHASRLHRRGRRPLRDPHAGSSPQRRHRLPALGGRAQVRAPASRRRRTRRPPPTRPTGTGGPTARRAGTNCLGRVGEPDDGGSYSAPVKLRERRAGGRRRCAPAARGRRRRR